MKILRFILALMFSLAWFACDESMIKDEEGVKTIPENLIGNWIDPQYIDTTVTYTRSVKLEDNGYGFTFKKENKFLERKNAGWCGTPPISYADYEGTWALQDSIFDIHVGYWGGTMDYKWKLMSMDQHHLTLYTISAELHPEEEY